MNCHGNNHNDNKNKHSIFKHSLMMVLCCGAPIIVLLLLTVFKINNSSVRGISTVISSLLCPLMMVGMIFMMFGKGKSKKSCCENEQIENKTGGKDN